jgi:glyoxylase-like metal-dependent hydrolase (beta-lactamase superfamily II)
MALPTYDVYAIKYAQRDARRTNHFLGGDPHDAPMPMDYQDRVEFHDGDDELAPVVTLHRIGGHTAGLQSVRVHTKRGWVVLASDASHYYEHFEKGRCFPTTYNVAETIQGYRKLQRLADSPQYIVPGHDPLVMSRYPAVSRDLEGIAVRLDVMPREA